MIYKRPCLVAVFLIILLHHITKQHYMPPPDFCAYAKTCNHTGASICGIETKNLTRLFLDDCDLYEYNCDHHKDYVKMDAEKCPSSETGLKSTIASTISTTFHLNISTIEANNTTEIMNTTVMESGSNPASETVITTSLQTNPSLNTTTPKVTCVCPTVTCPDLNITVTTISPVHNSTISSSNIMALSTVAVSSTKTTIDSTIMEATSNATNTEATINSRITEVTIPSTITEARKNFTSTEVTNNLTHTEAIINPTSTEATINSTITEATITLRSIEATINSTITTVTTNSPRTDTKINSTSSEAATKLTSIVVPTSVLTTVPIITNRINSTISVSNLITCTTSKTSLETDVILTTVATTPKDKEMVLPEFKENEKVNDGKDPKTSQDKCAYPKHCNRPSTWETTAKGETRDFYQILRAQFGDRVRLLRDTTHFPRRFAKDFSTNDEGFQFGYHNERTNEVLSK